MSAKSSKWAIVLAGACAAITFYALVTRDQEPSYRGLSLTEWLMQGWSGNVTTPFTPEATEAITEMGTDALPFLTKWVHDNSPESGAIAGLKSHIHELPENTTPAPIRRWADTSFNARRATAAALAFSVLGERASGSIPELTGILADPRATNAARHAAIGLTGIGPDGLQALTTHLADTNTPNRCQVAFALGWFPSLNTNASYVACFAALLTQCLSDPDPNVRSFTVMFLSRPGKYFETHGSLIAVALTNALRPELPLSTRLTAIVELGEIGVSASNAVPSLVNLLSDPDPRIRSHTSNALLRIAPRLDEHANPNGNALLPNSGDMP